MRKPKTARRSTHAAVQFVLIEDGSVATYLAEAKRQWLSLRTKLLPSFSERLLLRKWGQVLKLLRIASWGLRPASLRGGGATEHFLKYGNSPLLRRRGRWTSERTLEPYLQEGSYHMMHVPRFGYGWQTVLAVHRLSGDIFRSTAGREG